MPNIVIIIFQWVLECRINEIELKVVGNRAKHNDQEHNPRVNLLRFRLRPFSLIDLYNCVVLFIFVEALGLSDLLLDPLFIISERFLRDCVK